jgi:CheY-like chemotaxis protein
MNVKELTTLLADDDTDDCLFFKEAINKFIPAANFTAVHNGEELMLWLTNEKNKLPDVLFLDLNMPRKTGFECLSEIRQNATLKNIRVVIFSTSGEYDQITALFKTGADIYIRKPGNLNQLIQVIQHALSMATENIVAAVKLKYVLNA